MNKLITVEAGDRKIMNISGLLKNAWLFLLFPVFIYSEIPGTAQEKHADTVKIGFLIQDNKSVAALNGALLAIATANRHGGNSGTPFKLVYRSMEGPWGTGSKQAVDLIFEEKVWGIVGSHDGRNAHLVEQACTKTNVVFLSAWSSDPTLAQAFVPWFFNCVPDNIKQADLLADEIFSKNKFTRITVISDSEYDSQNALKFFIRQAGNFKNIIINQLTIKDQVKNRETTLAEIRKTNPQCLLLFCNPLSAYELIAELKENNIFLPVFSPLLIADENFESYKRICDSGYKIKIPRINLHPSDFPEFAKAFQNEFGTEPGLAAALAYDAVGLLIEAIREKGKERENLQEYILKCRYNGITGLITFDERGSRLAIKGLTEI